MNSRNFNPCSCKNSCFKNSVSPNEQVLLGIPGRIRTSHRTVDIIRDIKKLAISMAYYYLQFLAARTAYLLSPWRRQMMAEVSLTEADPKFCNPAAVPVKVPLGTCRCLFLWALSHVLLRFLLQAGCHHTLGTQHLGFDNSAGLIPVLAGGSFCSQTTFLRTSAYSKASEKFV